MRIAVISDIHSNYEALRVAIDWIEENSIDEIICLGDLVGYGPDVNECIELIKEKVTASLIGNHDSYLIGTIPSTSFVRSETIESLEYARSVILRENMNYLINNHYTLNSYDCYFVHSSPSNPRSWSYVSNLGRASYEFDFCPINICFFGHTHIPAVYHLDDEGQPGFDVAAGTVVLKKQYKYLINPGSIGQPRDGINKLSFLVYDDKNKSAEFIRLEYDIDAVKERIKQANLPMGFGKRLTGGY